MLPRIRSFVWAGALLSIIAIYLWTSSHQPENISQYINRPVDPSLWQASSDDSDIWRTIATDFPPTSIQTLPTGTARSFPKVQASFAPETNSARQVRQSRQDAVRRTFLKSWTSYRENAWGWDELKPLSGERRNPFGGWAASLIDALDTLWIMDFKAEFAEAVDAIEVIDFSKTELQEINTFETTIRHLGALLSAFDLSQDHRLLKKAVQVGNMLYKAFDTPNRMPITRWDIHAAMRQERQEARAGVLLAEIGSLSLEFTRLSQLTGDSKWFSAVQHIADLMAPQQDTTELPGLWPLSVNAKELVFNSGSTFTLGAMADSIYEYMPKMAALLGRQLPMYEEMYTKAMDTAVKHNFFRPMTPTDEDILVSGTVHTDSKNTEPDSRIKLDPQGQHLVCFLGGAMALGGRLFGRDEDVTIASKLTNGCIYAYNAFPHGIMPEKFHMLPCPSVQKCTWDENSWKQAILQRAKSENGEDTEADVIIREEHLPKGFTKIPDRRYILRPEAIESVFILYRVTGRAELADSAWDMFEAINATTATSLANTAVWDVTMPREKPAAMDSMESFWMSETLKYFYLVFSEPSLISLDKYVFNTEAHPFRRPV
ncbi:glycoside hydrolase [Mariannaea sp. PMI_226]|nr:glycoside hydrolase [Mariannaea sp. PMI_226]